MNNPSPQILRRARQIKDQHNSIQREREADYGYYVAQMMTIDEAIEIAEKEAKTTNPKMGEIGFGEKFLEELE